MRDHWHILGTLFKAWAVANIVTVLIFFFWRPGLSEAGAGPPGWVFVAFSAVAAVAYWFTGTRLRQHAPQFRPHALVLCALALLTFPIGTLMGAYGLWVMLKRAPAGTPS